MFCRNTPRRFGVETRHVLHASDWPFCLQQKHTEKTGRRLCCILAATALHVWQTLLFNKIYVEKKQHWWFHFRRLFISQTFHFRRSVTCNPVLSWSIYSQFSKELQGTLSQALESQRRRKPWRKAGTKGTLDWSRTLFEILVLGRRSTAQLGS